jgi:hypothetical protein
LNAAAFGKCKFFSLSVGSGSMSDPLKKMGFGVVNGG